MLISDFLKGCILKIFSVFVTLLGLSCAGRMPPSGGPIDTIPPEIIYSYPSNKMLNVRECKFILRFSEYVERRSVENAIFISPSVGKLSFDWRGVEVEITGSDTLRFNTTYVMTVGTDVKDRRNGNRMAQAFSLAFSTGEHIDSCFLSGKVYHSKAEGVMIFAYLIDGNNRDSIDPRKLKPDYITQTGKEGTFLLPYLKPGHYRVFAIIDEYKNLLYDQQLDQYGVAPRDFFIMPEVPGYEQLKFMLTKEDTAAPFISSVRALDKNRVLLRFSEQINSASITIENFIVSDSITNELLSIEDVAVVGPELTDVQIKTADQKSGVIYRLELGAIRDLRGNVMKAPQNISFFAAETSLDTIKPSIVNLTPKNGSVNVLRNDSVHINFSEAITREKFERGLHILDTIGNPINGSFIWKNSASVSFIPTSNLLYGMKYKVVILLDSVQDATTNCYKDSTYIVYFTTIKQDLLGSLSGVINDENLITKGRIHVIANPVAPKDIGAAKVIIDRPGVFVFNELQEGSYTLMAFDDADESGDYSYGNPFPYIPSENFVIYKDTLKIRARWPLEGVTLEFR